MAKFRKKPVIIDAKRCVFPFTIKTLEGDMKANFGDWIITGVNGEQYPCKDEIFRKTYEPAEELSEMLMKVTDRELLSDAR